MLDEHYCKHGQEIADVLGDSNYSIDKYLDDANYIVNNGTYVPELNGYVSFMSGKKYDYYNIANIARLLTELPDEDLKEVMFIIEYKRKRLEEKSKTVNHD